MSSKYMQNSQCIVTILSLYVAFRHSEGDQVLNIMDVEKYEPIS